ncbi:choice-of-anchor D domain-containing protein [Flavobacterium caeni]|uniref:Fibronectin type-III domain-containing protein n=1 Tax=Flavobacterium caeni TaxID=490189 RepID=A0A1G5ECB3_9FLAO|nr:choice-of-anchor D domain-containing protein [Flavobacterium caeni]SCY24557.1 hypothetical protein SAMN02927903_01011 [Flavobacterium caeni]
MKLKFLFFALLVSALSFGQSVVISQYIETTSGTTPKGIEIFNVTASDIVFSATNNIRVYQGNSGATCTLIAAIDINVGTLRAGEVWVIGTNDLTTYATTNGTGISGTTDYNFLFNGDDAVRIDLGGVTQDMIGVCGGGDPGTAWTGGGVSTANNNIQIIDGLCTGDPDGWTDPSTRYTTVAGGTVMTGFGNPPASCTTPCTTPTSQASGIAIANTTVGGTDISWTPGATATGSIVVIRPSASPDVLPVNGTNYNPSTAWGTAGQINVNNRVVYRSNGSSVTGITGLTPETPYTITVYAYNGSGTNICYNTTTPEAVFFVTLAAEPTGHSASFTCLTASSTQINLTFNAANTIGGDGYVILYRIGGVPTGVPTDGAMYPAGTVFGNATVHGYTSNVGTTTTYSVTGLNAGTVYHFLLVPYAAYLSDPSTMNYRTSATIPTTSCNTTIGPEINVRGVIGANPTIADGDTTPQGTDNTLFANIVIPGNQAKNFRIENNGNALLNITSITMVGGNTGDFAVSGITLPTTIAAGASLDFTVTFAPLAAGTRTTTLTIANDDSDENPYNFMIRGTGTLTALVDINVLGNGQSIPDNSIYPQGTNHTAFGVATVGVTTVVRTFTIENIGSTALTLTGSPYVQITGPHASMFTVTAQPASNTIAGSTSLTFDITFNPTGPGAKNATVVIANDDSDENPYNFNISGTAKGANNIYVYGNGNDVNKGATTTTETNLTHFGGVAVTTGVKQNTFVISNLSGSTVYFGGVTISGPDAAMFSVISQPTNNGLGSGNSSSFTINFTPASVGIKNATVSFNVYNNAGLTTPEPVDPIYTFAISGEGIVFTTCSYNAVQTLFVQDFEVAPATPTYGYSYTTDGTVAISGGTYDNGSGPRNSFIGARGFKMAGIGTTSSGNAVETTVITMSPVDVSAYGNINLSMKVGAFRTGTTQGVDVNELVQVETSVDNGVNWSTEAVLRGYSNSRWDFNATGVFNAYYTGTNNGVTIDTRNGNAELPNGIATYNVRNLPAVDNLRVRITLAIDRADEVWAIDDIKIEGQMPVATSWTGATWSAGPPSPTVKAIIDAPYDTGTWGSFRTCQCQVNSGDVLTINGNTYVEIQDNLRNLGTVNIESSGSLVQVNSFADNTGAINVARTATIKAQDYVYWSAPVDGFSVTGVSAATPAGAVFHWIPTQGGNFGIWGNTTQSMIAGKGYIVRSPNGWSSSAAPFTANFSGIPNNGDITPSIERGSYTGAPYPSPTNAAVMVTNQDDNWNLLGNPYPSSIRALDFLNANTNIEGAVRLWTHGALPSTGVTDPFYNNFMYNYNSNDYIVYNGTATTSGPAGFNGYIASGQGFFVQMDDGAADTQTVTFNNTMRSRTYGNAQFYRQAANQTESERALDGEQERSRVWLDLVGPTQLVSRAVVGYVNGATLEKDRLYDAFGRLDGGQNFYSLIGEQPMAIQGRPLPVDENDKVPVGFNVTQAGTYKIAIAAVDGVFDTMFPIYLEDKTLGIVHDLKQSAYEFLASPGRVDARFVLRYTNQLLGNDQFETEASGVAVIADNQTLSIKSYREPIAQVTVFDLTGREIAQRNDIYTNETQIAGMQVQRQALIVKIVLQDGKVVVRKVLL